MTDIHELEDGTFQVELPNGRLATSDSPQALQQLIDELNQQHKDETLFLEAWKVAVRYAGARFFAIDVTDTEHASDKEQLRPDLDAIKEGIGALSGGEKRFLVAVYSFFNRQVARDLADEFGIEGNPGELAAHLDRDRLDVITTLMRHYTGW